MKIPHPGVDLPTMQESGAAEPGLDALREEARKQHLNHQAHCQSLWGTSTKVPFRSYDNVAVLLLHWEETDLNESDYHAEIKSLGAVFNEKYGFQVVPYQLTNPNTTKAQQSLIAGISSFLYKYDQKNTLLIIYYGGHGFQARNHEFLLNNKADSQTDTGVSWTRAEELLLQDSVLSDVLCVFDCCHAGSLLEEPRGPRSFEFLAACRAHSNSPPAGPRSFTTALIWALEELLNDTKSWHTIDKLKEKIRAAPNFDKDQCPQWRQRGQACHNITLARSSKLVSAETQKQRDDAEEPYNANCEFLDIRLRFPHGLDDDELKKTSEILHNLIPADLSATEIIFLEKHDKHVPRDRWDHALDIVRKTPWFKRHRKRQRTVSPMPDLAPAATYLASLPSSSVRLLTPALTDVGQDDDMQHKSDVVLESQVDESAVDSSSKRSADIGDDLDHQAKRLC